MTGTAGAWLFAPLGAALPRWLCLVLLVPAALPADGLAGPPKAKPLLADDQTRAAVAATAAVTLHDPLGTTGMVVFGQGTMLWEGGASDAPEKSASTGAAAPLDPAILAGVEDREPVRNADENYDEYQAFNFALLQAHKTPAQALAKGARRDLTYAHLFEEPEKYRGHIVHVEGRLRRLRKFDTNRQVTKEGVPILYEGWIFDEHAYGNPYCVLITELPGTVELGEAISHSVAFDGYYFKRYRYKAGDGVRDAPLLIGRSLSVRPGAGSEPESAMSIPDWLLWAFLVLLIGTFVLGIGLAWWFHRGDRRVRLQLERNRSAGFFEPEEENHGGTP